MKGNDNRSEIDVQLELQHAGWIFSCQDSKNATTVKYDVEVDNLGVCSYSPDIILYDNEQRIIGGVEVKTYLPLNLDTFRIASMIRTYIYTQKPPVFIFTNGYVYDTYFFGKHFAQTHFCPSVELLNIIKPPKRSDVYEKNI